MNATISFSNGFFSIASSETHLRLKQVAEKKHGGDVFHLAKNDSIDAAYIITCQPDGSYEALTFGSVYHIGQTFSRIGTPLQDSRR